MSNRRLLLPSLAIAVTWLCSCSSTTEADEEVESASYFRVEGGHAWDYGQDITDDWPLEDSLFTYLRSGEPTGDGTAIPFTFSRGLEDAQPDALLTVLLDLDGGDVVVAGLIDADGTGSIFDPPPVLGPASWGVGDTSSTDTTLDGAAVSWQVELTEFGDHDVHYGTFHEAAAVRIDDGGATPLGGTWWLAPEVGPIRIETDSDLIGTLDLLTYR